MNAFNQNLIKFYLFSLENQVFKNIKIIIFVTHFHSLKSFK